MLQSGARAREKIDKFLINVVYSTSIACTDRRLLMKDATVLVASAEVIKHPSGGFVPTVTCTSALIEIDDETIDKRPELEELLMPPTINVDCESERRKIFLHSAY